MFEIIKELFGIIFEVLMDLIFWIVLIFGILIWLFSEFVGYISPQASKKTSKTKSYKPKKTKTTTQLQNTSTKKPRRLPGVHEDYDEELKKELIKEGKYDSFNFDEEEDLEEDDYNYEDDK